MKTNLKNFKKWLGGGAMVSLVALSLSACIKNNNNNNIVQAPVAALTVIDASPDAPVSDLVLNTDKVGYNPLSLGSYLGYFNAYAGQRKIIFYQTGTTNVVAQDTVTLKANQYYTFLFANLQATPDFILLKDSLSKPASGFSSIRLINVSPDAGPIDLVVKGGSSLVTNISYKGASAFANLTPSAADTLQVRAAGTSTVLATVPYFKSNSSTVYTVWLYGLANTSVAAQKLNANVMVNAYFY